MVHDEVITSHSYNDFFLLLNMPWTKKVFVSFLSSSPESKISFLWEMLSSNFFLKIRGLIVYKIRVSANEGSGPSEIKMITKINNKNNEVLQKPFTLQERLIYIKCFSLTT